MPTHALAIPLTAGPEEVVVSRSFPFVGASQDMCIIRPPHSEVPPSRFMLEESEIGQTVLAAVYQPESRVYLPTPLPPPQAMVRLPRIDRSLLREQPVYNPAGQYLGQLVRLPGLLVHANRIVEMHRAGRKYDHAHALAMMATEAAYLLGRVLKRGVLKVREKPGFFAHAIANSRLELDQVGVSEAFAQQVFASLQRQGMAVPTLDDLNGYPVWAVRFPIANRWGLQALHLRILEGTGRYIATHPWNLKTRWMGDCDGDCLFVLLRQAELKAGIVRREPQPMLRYDGHIGATRAVASLQGLANPAHLPLTPPLAKKLIVPPLATTADRVNQIQRCDSRAWVATFTMVFGWWVPRILATTGHLTPQAAYQVGYDALEWWIESTMDARKGESNFADFPIHAFMQLLTQGGEPLPLEELARLQERTGMPDVALEPLKLAWVLSGQNLKGACASSPVYKSLILERSRQERAIVDLLQAVRRLGIPPAELYHKIVADLSGIETLPSP